MRNTIKIIENAFDDIENLLEASNLSSVREAVEESLEQLNSGALRIAAPSKNGWVVNEWAKKAVLLSFRLSNNKIYDDGTTKYYDKVKMKFEGFSQDQFQDIGARVVPHATVRNGVFIGKNVVLMPSYVNIGAYVGDNTMIDTWATVGSCAQIGKNVHLSGGAGIGGVLEPLQASPTIIEDNCFIGARSEVVEGVIVGAGSVLSMGVFLGQSTKIYNRNTGEISAGIVPPGSVVVPGSLPSKDGSHSLNCAIIVKTVDEKTRSKVSINELLRDF